MHFLVDECTGPSVARWLHSQGHTVFSVFDEARGLRDGQIIQKAFVENWILITIDQGFWGVYLPGWTSPPWRYIAAFRG